MSKLTKSIGHTDLAAKEDAFEINRYIDGLAKFILNCPTPITMAIQGDWGTGKTSIMQMVYDRLDKHGLSNNLVWFNTWQFSQFNMGNQLPLLMMGKLVSAVAGDASSKKKAIMDKLGKFGGTMLNMAVGYVSGGTATAEGLIDGDKLTDFIDAIDKLKAEFQDLISSKTSDGGRVVIFIDDLDRLEPGRAVELLEVLKIFLDCEDCVFVLAIDYNVVVRGVRDKYGADFGAEKGRSFFDKIIQVPFKMPIADYNIDNYVRRGLEDVGIAVGDGDINVYKGLIESSIGSNPRSMKRLFNSYLLLSMVADEKLLSNPLNQRMLFAILCMQSSFEPIYNKLIENREKLDSDSLAALKEPSDSIISELGLDETYLNDHSEAFGYYSENLFKAIDLDGSGSLSEEEVSAFHEVLNFSTITANETKKGSAASGPMRWVHKDWAQEYVKKLEPRFESIAIKDYYKRNAEPYWMDSWWITTGKFAKTSQGDFKVDVRFSPSKVDDSLSDIIVSLWRQGKKNDFAAMLDEIGGSDPFGFLGVEPELTDGCITYTMIENYDGKTNEQSAEILENIVKIFEAVERFY